MTVELYGVLAEHSLKRFLKGIDVKCTKCIYSFPLKEHGHVTSLNIKSVKKEAERVYSVHLSGFPFHGEFLLVYVSDNEEEFDKIVWVYADLVGRGEIILEYGSGLADVEDWLRYHTFLPDLDYAPERQAETEDENAKETS